MPRSKTLIKSSKPNDNRYLLTVERQNSDKRHNNLNGGKGHLSNIGSEEWEKKNERKLKMKEYAS